MIPCTVCCSSSEHPCVPSLSGGRREGSRRRTHHCARRFVWRHRTALAFDAGGQCRHAFWSEGGSRITERRSETIHSVGQRCLSNHTVSVRDVDQIKSYSRPSNSVGQRCQSVTIDSEYFKITAPLFTALAKILFWVECLRSVLFASKNVKY